MVLVLFGIGFVPVRVYALLCCVAVVVVFCFELRARACDACIVVVCVVCHGVCCVMWCGVRCCVICVC